MSSLPLGLNEITIQRGLTTSSVAIFVPFTTQELFQTGKEALYCGINALSNNLIMVDRKLLKNPNGLILGTPGSGKSFSAKREIANVFLVTDDDIIICDPEAEYGPLVEHLHGQVIKISPTSTDYINPMDLNLNCSDDENPLSLKSDFILSLCELIVGGKDGLMPVEKTIIDRCVRLAYWNYLNDPRPENMPTLGDLYEELRKQDEKEAQYIATALEIYVTGSLNVFNHQTNAWRCVSRLDYGAKYCHQSPTMDEEPLQRAIMAAINSVVDPKGAICSQITEAAVEETGLLPDSTMTLGEINRRLEELEAEFNILRQQPDSAVKNAERFGSIANEMASLKEQREKIAARLRKDQTVQAHVHSMEAALDGMSHHMQQWDEEMIRQLVHTVKVISADHIKVFLYDGMEIDQAVSP